jgi:hypothetical protein
LSGEETVFNFTIINNSKIKKEKLKIITQKKKKEKRSKINRKK